MSDLPRKYDDLPSSWLHTQLGRVVNYGRTTKVEPTDIPADAWVLELEDIEKDSSRILQQVTFSQRQSKSTKNKFLAGDVLYGKLRPYLNKVVIADRPGYCTTEIVPINAGLLDNRFLFYWLKHPTFLKYVEAESHGLSMPRLGTETGKAAPFVLPPREEQTRIANHLDSLLARINACNDQLSAVPMLLNRFRKAVLGAATTGKLTEEWRKTNPVGSASDDLAERISQRSKTEKKPPSSPDLRFWKTNLPAGWVVGSVHQFSECLDRRRVPIKKDARKSVHGLYPYYGANGEVGRIDNFIFDDELVLVTEDETFYGRVKPIAYRSSGRCWVNNHAHVLRAPTKAANDYLCYSLMYYDVLPWLTGTTGRAKLTQQALNALPIAVPPKEEIEEIARRVEALFKFADQIEACCGAAITHARRLTPLTLAKAFRGELVQQNPQDEPASLLLQRIAGKQPEKLKTARGRPRVKKPEAADVSSVALPDWSTLPAGAWAAQVPTDEHTATAQLTAVLKAWNKPMPQDTARLATLLCLQPRLLTAALPADHAAQWSRLVGDAAAPLPAQVVTLQPAFNTPWRNAISKMRAREDLVESGSGAQGTWALGPGAARVNTAGWPDGRAGWVVHYLQTHGVEAVLPTLATEVQEFVHARAA